MYKWTLGVQGLSVLPPYLQSARCLLCRKTFPDDPSQEVPAWQCLCPITQLVAWNRAWHTVGTYRCEQQSKLEAGFACTRISHCVTLVLQTLPLTFLALLLTLALFLPFGLVITEYLVCVAAGREDPEMVEAQVATQRAPPPLTDTHSSC